MLIGVVGTICAGKHTTAEYLVQNHGFLRLHLPTKSLVAEHGSDDWTRLLPSVTDEKGTRGLTFPDVDALLEFVTKRWREHWVLTDISDEATLEALLRRPFFMLLSVDAPVSVRFRRFSERCIHRGVSPLNMESFVTINDLLLYGSNSTIDPIDIGTTVEHHNDNANSKNRNKTNNNPSSAPTTTTTNAPSITTTGTALLTSHSHMQILNHTSTVQSYHNLLSTLSLPSTTHLRPPWDAYFMHLAHLASLRSNCMKRRVGCVLIHNNRIISTGYNGTPRNLTNCNEGGCPRCNSGPGAGAGLSTCLCLHAEENALLEAGRERIREGAVLYCDTCPCLTCSVKIAQVGVKEVVYSQSYNMDADSRRVLAEAGVGLRQFSVPKGGLVGLRAEDSVVLGGSDAGQDMVVVRNGR